MNAISGLLDKPSSAKPLNHWHDTRAAAKAQAPLVKHVVGLPWTAARLALLDEYIVDSKKSQGLLMKVDELKKDFSGAAAAAAKRSMDIEKVKLHFTATKKKFLGTVASCGEEALVTHEAAVNAVCDEFDKIVQLLGGLVIGSVDKQLKAAFEAARDALLPDAGVVDRIAIVKQLQALLLPHMHFQLQLWWCV